jgi:hypothetical protein
MAHLNELKVAIDSGQIVKLRQWRTVLHWYVKKERGVYLKRAEGYINPAGMIVARPQTLSYEKWEELVNSFGYDATLGSWQLTNEFREYFPVEQLPKATPSKEEQHEEPS